MPLHANLFRDKSFPAWDLLPRDMSFESYMYGLGMPLSMMLGHNQSQYLEYDTHWCFLAEIQECNGSRFLRYRTLVKDDNNKESFVAFYPDSYEGFDWKKLKRGHTLAIMYANQHYFQDRTSGVRVEDMDYVHVFPASLRELQRIGAEMNKYSAGVEGGRWRCHGCDEVKPSHQISRCGNCKLVGYCGKECQAKGWSERDHKKHCKVIRDPNFMALMKLDFSKYEGAFAFQRD